MIDINDNKIRSLNKTLQGGLGSFCILRCWRSVDLAHSEPMLADKDHTVILNGFFVPSVL